MFPNLKKRMKQRLQCVVFNYRPLLTHSLFFPYKGAENSFSFNGKTPSDVPPENLWHGYENFIESGANDVKKLRETIPGNFDRILDFGCAAGRMIRHFREEAENGEVWGVDIGSEHIFWCKQHLSPPFRFATVTSLPHLPFEDRYFDLIYCGSVFTHIDDLTEAWLLELRRILRGRLYITIHDEHTAELLRTKYRSHPMARFNGQLNQDFDMLVIGRDADSQVFYRRDYFLQILSQMFEIESVAPEAYGYQTAIVVKRNNL